VKNRADIAPHGQEGACAEGHGGARHGSMRANLFRGGGRSFGPPPRSHAIELPKKVRALALRHALSSKAKDGGLIVIDGLAVKEAKTKALIAQFEKARLVERADHRRRADRGELRPRGAQTSRTSTCCVQGINVYDILAASEARADEGRRRGAGGAVQMSVPSDPRLYDVILLRSSPRRRRSRPSATRWSST
jgi:large subunit ribosomal protein L4